MLNFFEERAGNCSVLMQGKCSAAVAPLGLVPLSPGRLQLGAATKSRIYHIMTRTHKNKICLLKTEHLYEEDDIPSISKEEILVAVKGGQKNRSSS